MWPFAVVLLFLGTLGGCRTAAVEGRERPDPWVFRSVLDGNARMLSACLAPDLWIAWDVERGKLHRFWAGGVVFTGAVYDSLHGPQPLSRGPAYMEWPEGGLFEGWSLASGERISPQWQGYRLVGREGREELRLMWRVEREGAPGIELTLIPSGHERDGRVVLELRWQVEGLGAEEWLSVDLPPATRHPAQNSAAARETSGTVVLLGDRLGIGPRGGRLRLAFERLDPKSAGAGAAEPSLPMLSEPTPAEDAPEAEEPLQ